MSDEAPARPFVLVGELVLSEIRYWLSSLDRKRSEMTEGVKVLSFRHQRSCQVQQLARGDASGHLHRLVRRAQPLVKGAQHWVVTDCRQCGEVRRRTQPYLPRGEVVGQQPPSCSRTGHPAQGIEHIAQVVLPLRGVEAHQGERRHHELPFIIAHRRGRVCVFFPCLHFTAPLPKSITPSSKCYIGRKQQYRDLRCRGSCLRCALPFVMYDLYEAKDVAHN